VDTDGSFDLELSPDSELSQLASDNGGFVNLRVSAFRVGSTSYATTRFTFVHLGQGEFSSAPPLDIQYTAQDVTSPSPSTNPTAGQGQRSAIGAIVPPTTRSSYEYGIPGVCVDVHEEIDAENRYTLSGEYHSSPGMTGYWGYGETADSEIEAAIRQSGGQWSGAGVAKINNTGSSQVRLSRSGPWAKRVKTAMHYVHEKHWIQCIFWEIDVHYETRATRWVGGTEEGVTVGGDGLTRAKAAGTSGRCVAYEPGSAWTKKTGRASTYEAAVSVFGASLKATSGWSGEVIAHYNTGSTNDWYAFFGEHTPPDVAQIVYTASGQGTKPLGC
jgi:hypothetical protein